MKNRRSSIFYLVPLLVVLIFTLGCTTGKAQVRNSRDSAGYPDSGEFTRIDELGFEDNTKKESRAAQDSFRQQKHQNRDENRLRDRRVASSYNAKREKKEANYYQKGAASWYGREFHGKLTASGDRFSMYEYTAAHKTLPFGSYIEVTNLKNGRTVTVKINDRGPYRGNRIIDLSYTAAKQIDMLGAGEVPVGIVVIKRGSDEKRYQARSENDNRTIEPVVDTDTSRKSRYGGSRFVSTGNVVVQAGAFFSRRNAEKLKTQISRVTDRPVVVSLDGDLYKVKIKGLPSRNEAERLRSRLAGRNIKSFIKD